MKVLAAQPALKGVRVGITGFSRGGWIAPIAAERSGLAQFLVLWSGPICKVSEENIDSQFASDGSIPVDLSIGNQPRATASMLLPSGSSTNAP